VRRDTLGGVSFLRREWRSVRFRVAFRRRWKGAFRTLVPPQEVFDAMMRQMRQNTKIIMLVTALAFVALMVFEWGMDMSGQTAGGDLGRVGGTPVTIQQFQATYRNLYDQVQRSQEEPISSAQNREIEDAAWEELVTQILIRKELDRRGIRVTDEEIRQAARFSPPPQFQQDPAFQTDGRFDLQKYQEFLAQAAADPFFLQQLEQYYRDIIPRGKLLRQLTSGVYVSDAELWRLWRDRNERVEVSYLLVDPDRIVSDQEVEVTAREVERYYRDHRERFALPARADVRYAFIDKAPTAADTAASRERALAVRQEILDGADFAEVAQRESADPGSAARGGDLGTFGRGDMVAPFDEAAFSLPVGQVSEPVQTPFGLHVIEVTSREDERVQARHILIPVERTEESEFRMLSRADSLETLGQNRTLADAAEAMGLEVMEGEITDDFAILPGVGPAEEGQDWIFVDREGPGAVSPVFENRQVFYMLEILREAPAGYLSLEEVRGEIEAYLRAQRKLDRAQEEARRMREELDRGAVTLEGLGERLGMEVRRAGPFTRTENVPGLGVQNAAIGAAFGTAEGEIAGPVRSAGQIVLLRVEGKEAADRDSFEEQKELQRAQVTAQRRQERLERWIDGLRETIRIVDRRAEYFRAVEEADDRPGIPLVF
jgi:peptidyl-prolyl cis-trans isomerase D